MIQRLACFLFTILALVGIAPTAQAVPLKRILISKIDNRSITNLRVQADFIVNQYTNKDYEDVGNFTGLTYMTLNGTGGTFANGYYTGPFLTTVKVSTSTGIHDLPEVSITNTDTRPLKSCRVHVWFTINGVNHYDFENIPVNTDQNVYLQVTGWNGTWNNNTGRCEGNFLKPLPKEPWIYIANQQQLASFVNNNKHNLHAWNQYRFVCPDTNTASILANALTKLQHASENPECPGEEALVEMLDHFVVDLTPELIAKAFGVVVPSALSVIGSTFSWFFFNPQVIGGGFSLWEPMPTNPNVVVYNYYCG